MSCASWTSLRRSDVPLVFHFAVRSGVLAGALVQFHGFGLGSGNLGAADS